MNDQELRKKVIGDKKLIVSLTSFPGRIKTVHISVERILRNSIQPDKFVLYLATPQFPNGLADLPEKLRALSQANNIFEIRFTPDDMRQHKNMAYGLVDFPDDFILKIDDDVLYKKHFIRRILFYAAKNPGAIIGGRGRRLKVDETGLLSLTKTKKVRFNYFWRSPSYTPSFLNFPEGVGGKLYPPHSLHPDASNRELIKKICNDSEDAWNHFMGVRQGTKSIVLSNFHNYKIPGSQKHALRREGYKMVDKHKCQKDIMIQNIFAAYPEILEAVMSEYKKNNKDFL